MSVWWLLGAVIVYFVLVVAVVRLLAGSRDCPCWSCEEMRRGR